MERTIANITKIRGVALVAENSRKWYILGQGLLGMLLKPGAIACVAADDAVCNSY